MSKPPQPPQPEEAEAEVPEPLIEREPPCPDDADHRTMRKLGLTVVGCRGRSCENMRDLATIAASRFGYEDDKRYGGRVLAAIDRVNAR